MISTMLGGRASIGSTDPDTSRQAMTTVGNLLVRLGLPAGWGWLACPCPWPLVFPARRPLERAAIKALM